MSTQNRERDIATARQRLRDNPLFEVYLDLWVKCRDWLYRDGRHGFILTVYRSPRGGWADIIWNWDYSDYIPVPTPDQLPDLIADLQRRLREQTP